MDCVMICIYSCCHLCPGPCLQQKSQNDAADTSRKEWQNPSIQTTKGHAGSKRFKVLLNRHAISVLMASHDLTFAKAMPQKGQALRESKEPCMHDR